MKLRVYIKPGSKTEGLAYDGEQIVARIAALPKDGEANKQLVHVLATWLGVPKSSVQIATGHTSRIKTISVDLPAEAVQQAIAKLDQLPQQTKLA